MSSREIITYVGRYEGTGWTDESSGIDLIGAVAKARGLLIVDPMSFPWELLPEDEPACPMLVDISRCSDDDIRALVPVLHCLTPSDAILGDGARTHALCTRIGLPDLRTPPDLDVDAFVDQRTWSKRADVEERIIRRRLERDPSLTVRSIDGDHLRSAGFETVVRELLADLEGSTVDTIWGIHPYPGRRLDRAVVALRPRTP